MIKLILIIIIIFFLSKIIIKEQFYSNDYVYDNKCNFYPHGNNKDDCIKKCRYSKMKIKYDLYNKCDLEKCNNKCDMCKNNELCPWTHPNNENDNSDKVVCPEPENKNCENWASSGECTINPGYMLQFCKNACVKQLRPWENIDTPITENIKLTKDKVTDNSQIKIKWVDPSLPTEPCCDKYLIYYKNQTNKAINVIEFITPPGFMKEKKITFNIVTLDKYQFNENLIINNKYEFIIYGIHNNNTIKSNKLLVYT